MKKRLFSILLTLALILTLNPAPVYAAPDSANNEPAVTTVAELESVESQSYGLPINVGSSDDDGEIITGPVSTVSSLYGYANSFKEHVSTREPQFTIKYDYQFDLNGEELTNELYEEKYDLINQQTADAVYTIALAHDIQCPSAGDYLLGQIAWERTIQSKAAVYGDNDYAVISFSYTYNMTYYTTSDEERVVTETISEILSDGTLNLDGLSDYEKIKAIHDFVCNQTTYDTYYYGNQTQLHQYTAYAALIEGTAVCQGYSLLFYRLCLEAGIDARFISGNAGGEDHAWNIVKLDGYYYYVDTTWDDTYDPEGAIVYDFFLKGANSIFAERTPDESFTTPEFAESYPIAQDDYKEPPTFEKASLILGGQIGVNFFLDLPDVEGADYSNSCMKFSINGEESSEDSFNPEDMNDTGEYYCFTCPISSIQMADVITAKYCYTVNGEDYYVQMEYSAKEYINNFMGDLTQDDYDDPKKKVVIDLVQTLADYGYYAQEYLSGIRGWTIGVDHYPMDEPATTFKYNEVSTYLNAASSLTVESNDSIAALNYSLLLDTNTALCVYVTPADGYDGTMAISVKDYSNITQETLPDGRYRICITDIGAHMLKKAEFTISITADTQPAASMTISVLNYLDGLLHTHPDDQNVINLTGSLYKYAEAAATYKEVLGPN